MPARSTVSPPRILADWLRSAWQPVLLVVGCLVLAGLILPRWLNELASPNHGPPTIEASIRWYLWVTMALSLAASAVIRWPRWSQGMRLTWLALVGLLVILIPLFVFDEMMMSKEKSWIWYPTAGCLVAAGLASLALTKLRRTSALARRETILWRVLSVGFVLLALDEGVELHERVGRVMDRAFGIEVAGLSFQDLTTIAYAAIGLSALLFYWLWLGRYTPSGEHWLLRGYLTAVAVFAVSQLFDAYNPEVLSGLRNLAERLADRGHGFPDIWFVLYHPRQFLNSAEELLECIAAVLFVVFTGRFALASWRSRAAGDALGSGSRRTAGRGLWAGRWALGITTVLLVFVGGPAAMTTRPFAGAEGPFTTRRAIDGDSSELRGQVVLPNGDLLEVDPRSSELVRRSPDGNERQRVRVRQMLRGLSGVGTTDGGLFLLTTTDAESSFMPQLVWRVEHAEEVTKD